MLGQMFQPFVEKSAVSVMARAALERLLSPQWVDEVFEQTEGRHYTRTLLFSSVFTLMVRVVFGHAKSVRKAYLPQASEIAVSLASVYNKLNGIPLTVPRALVRESAVACAELIDRIGGQRESDLTGYRLRILDGNCVASTQHRIQELRTLGAGALPGKSLVVFDPALRCAIDLVPSEDGHVQERALLGEILPTVKRGDLWIADRNFCTRGFLFGIADRDAHFGVREHHNLPVQSCGAQKKVGTIPTGRVFEQPVKIVWQGENGEEKVLHLRRVTVRLKGQTRDGDREIHILTNLPKQVKATKVANLYRSRWRIETAFQELQRDLNSEIHTLGYPRAALFAFSIALVAYNIMALVYAALRATHGASKIDEEFSHNFLADELELTHRGMMIAVPDEHWAVFATMTDRKFAAVLLYLARHVDLTLFPKSKRGPKKKPPKKKYSKKEPHVSTAKILAKRKEQ